jgi:hypothetical protein
MDPRRVDIHINGLRRKLGAYVDQYIENRYRGFCFRVGRRKLRNSMAIVAGQPGQAGQNPLSKQNAPQSSGIYAIYSARWIYIGDSNDIQRKLLGHWNGDNACNCITRAVPTAFAFEVCNLAERVQRQAALFGPICNQL